MLAQRLFAAPHQGALVSLRATRPAKAAAARISIVAKGGSDKKDKGKKSSKEQAPPPPPMRSAGAAVRPEFVVVDDASTGRSLECLLRRRVTLDDGTACGLLTPLDTSINILRYGLEGNDEEGLDSLSDEELEAVLPAMEEALLMQRGLLLRRSAHCLTVRGAVRYNDADVLTVEEDDEDEESALKGVELVSFSSGMDDYMVYAAVDPLVLLAAPPLAEGAGWRAMLDYQGVDAALEAAIEELEDELVSMSSEM